MLGSKLSQQLKVTGKAQVTAPTQGDGNLQLKKALKSSSLSKSKREYSQLGLSVLEGKPTWRQNRQGQEERSPTTANTSFKEMKTEGKEQTVKCGHRAVCSATWRSRLWQTPSQSSFFPAIHRPCSLRHLLTPLWPQFPHTFTRLVIDARRYLGIMASNNGSRDKTSCRKRAPHVIWVEERRNWGGRMEKSVAIGRQ